MPKKPSKRIHRITRKSFAGKVLPGATIYGVRPNSTEYVAWDGKEYVLRPSKENVLADDSLMPIGSVQELRVEHPHPGPSYRIEVVIPTRKPATTQPLSFDKQLKNLRDECRLTSEQIAEGTKLSPRSVFRHLSGAVKPRRNHIAVYEAFFTTKAGKQVRFEMS